MLQQLRYITRSVHKGDLCLRKVIQYLNPAVVDEIDMRTIQIDRFVYSEMPSALSIKDGGQLGSDLPLQLEQHLALAFSNLRYFEHHRSLSDVSL